MTELIKTSSARLERANQERFSGSILAELSCMTKLIKTSSARPERANQERFSGSILAELLDELYLSIWLTG